MPKIIMPNILYIKTKLINESKKKAKKKKKIRTHENMQRLTHASPQSQSHSGRGRANIVEHVRPARPVDNNL